MNKVNREPAPAADSALERVVEPLASYICATEQPRAVLRFALSMLKSEVERTNREAGAHIATFWEHQCL
jgi:hypothetical protein